LNSASVSGAMSLEAMRGTATAFDPKIQNVRPHPGQKIIAEDLRRILGVANGYDGKSAIASSHEDCGRVQDPYSLRCMPQVHGAVYDVLRWVGDILEREIISVTDNPLIFPKADEVLSGGNFHGQILAFAMDFLAISMSEIASISEQRIDKLMNPALSGLPIFLIPKSGINSGFMIVQYAAAAIVSENKTLCHPASVDSIPTNVDKEDHVSMGAWAARKALKVVSNVRRVLAMEFLCAAQGVELLRPLRSSAIVEDALQEIRKRAKFRRDDREFSDDIQALEKWLEESVEAMSRDE